MTVLLTGGTGYIGSHVAVALEQAGIRTVLYDNLCNSSGDVVERLRQILGHAPGFVEGDVRDQDALEQTMRDHDIQAVVHFAGLKAVGESVEKPLEYYDNNVVGSLRLLGAMQATGVKRVVFSSSATVYGDPEYLPYDESHPLAPTNPYGQTKLHIENMLRDMATSDPSVTAICLRYFNPVGAHDSGLIGENPRGIPNNLMPYVARVATGQLDEIQIFGDDYETVDGTGVRDYIHVNDLASGHLAAVQASDNMSGWHAINLGSGQGVSVLQLIAAFETACDKSLPKRIAPRRAGDLAEFYAQVDKAAVVLNWRTERTVDDMCSSVWKFNQMLTDQASD